MVTFNLKVWFLSFCYLMGGGLYIFITLGMHYGFYYSLSVVFLLIELWAFNQLNKFPSYITLSFCIGLVGWCFYHISVGGEQLTVMVSTFVVSNIGIIVYTILKKMGVVW